MTGMAGTASARQAGLRHDSEALFKDPTQSLVVRVHPMVIMSILDH
jgi:hypothetical protein